MDCTCKVLEERNQHVLFINKCVFSKKQYIVTHSSTEVEYHDFVDECLSFLDSNDTQRI